MLVSNKFLTIEPDNHRVMARRLKPNGRFLASSMDIKQTIDVRGPRGEHSKILRTRELLDRLIFTRRCKIKVVVTTRYSNAYLDTAIPIRMLFVQHPVAMGKLK